MNEISELRAISSHVLGASRVQIPQNNLDNLQSIREEEDGATKVSDPRDDSTLFFSLLLGVHEILSFFVLPEGFDPLALVEGFTPVEDNRGVIATNFLLGIGYSQKDEKRSKTDKTEHGIEKGAKSQSQSQKAKVKK
ncbi:hypothetical protein Tco_1513818, partial [Tanacetum coccineum]